MKRYLLFVLIAFCCITGANARTVMTMTNGQEIEVIIETMGTNEITYKKASNPNGTSYTTARSNVFFIIYDDGTKEVITSVNQPQNATKTETLAQHAMGLVAVGDTIPKKNYYPRISFYPRFNIGFHATPSGYKDSYDIDWGGLAYSFDLNLLLPSGNESAWSIGLGMASLSGEMRMLYTTNGGKDKHKDKMGKMDALYLTIPIEYYVKGGDWFTLGFGNRLDFLVSQKMEGKKVKDAFNGFRDALFLDGICTIGNFDAGARLLINFTSAFKGDDLDWSPTIGLDFTIGYRF